MNNFDLLPLEDRLTNKINAFYQTIWKEKWKEGCYQEWLDNFNDIDEEKADKEKLNMLYLLSKFMYFGNEELRQLLISLYRDLFKYPIIADIRKRNKDSIDIGILNNEFKKELAATRFLGVGNPSESGVHMLYYFRQENKLSKTQFINSSQIFKTQRKTEKTIGGIDTSFLKTEINDVSIKRYIYIDDFCGSGTQARDYLSKEVTNLKSEDSSIQVSYLMLFGTENGINQVKNLKVFDKVEAVFTIDETFKAFSDKSRYFKTNLDDRIDKIFSEETARKYGDLLFNPPLGYGNCQLLLGLSHNTPDNSLPIFWSDYNQWQPLFKRYNKIY